MNSNRNASSAIGGQRTLKSTGGIKPWLKDQEKRGEGADRADIPKNSSFKKFPTPNPSPLTIPATGASPMNGFLKSGGNSFNGPTKTFSKKPSNTVASPRKSPRSSGAKNAASTFTEPLRKAPLSPTKKSSSSTQWKKTTQQLEGSKTISVIPVRSRKPSVDRKGETLTTPSARHSLAQQVVKPKAQDEVLLRSILAQLQDKKHSPHVEDLICRIQVAGGFPQRRRLSLRDNDLVTTLERAIVKDPTIVAVDIDSDPRFAHLSKTQIADFASSLHLNLHLREIKITCVDLDNSFLSALSTSVESNCSLETIDLSRNAFTSDGLVEFCQAIGYNETVKYVDLRHQISPVLATAEETVLESLKKNRALQEFLVEVKSAHVQEAIQKLLSRNRQAPHEIDRDLKILEALEAEATRSEELAKQQLLMSKSLEINSEDDWGYLYDLSTRANKYQLASSLIQNDEAKLSLNASSNHQTVTSLQARQKCAEKIFCPSVNMTADGAFLTNDYISTYLIDSPDTGSLTFAFQTNCKLFKRFPIGDATRQFISEKFADTLLHHPRAKDITHINMANCACGDEWLARLCNRCLQDPTMLPNLHSLNLETNYISTVGVLALSQCLANPATWRFLQSVKLENQRHLVSSHAELELAKALCKNRSVIRFSLRVRNLWEREQINKFVSRNMDFLRQARVHHAKETGTQIQRVRNAMEKLFDKVAADDPTLTEVEVVGNQVFLSLPRDEIMKAARAFATNTHVKTVRMTMLRLDDAFAGSLATSLETNTAIEKLVLESNMIGSEGILDLVRSLEKNKSIVELQLRHQSKPLGSADEDKIPGLLQGNAILCKLGLDLRGTLPQTELERVLARNRELARKTRQEQVTGSAPASAAAKKLPKSQLQVFLEKVANNDPSIVSVELVGDKQFLAMKANDRIAAARSLSNNSHVKSVRMTMLQLDDAFCEELASSLRANTTIEKVHLDSNRIGSAGIRALLAALENNTTVSELQIRHQAKPIPTADEETVLARLEKNTALIKLGIDLRSPKAQRDLDHKLSANRDRQRQVRKSRSFDQA